MNEVYRIAFFGSASTGLRFCLIYVLAFRLKVCCLRFEVRGLRHRTDMVSSFGTLLLLNHDDIMITESTDVLRLKLRVWST